MIPHKVFSILRDLLPMVVLFTIVMGSVRMASIIIAHKKIDIWKELRTLLYVIYCFALFQLVTTTDFESFSNNFTPFKEIMRYSFDSPLFYRNVLGNIAIFVPFGFIVSDMLKEINNKYHPFWTILLVTITSLTIEIIQMFIGRSFDIDDIMLNVVGGIIGDIIYIILSAIKRAIIKRGEIHE